MSGDARRTPPAGSPRRPPYPDLTGPLRLFARRRHAALCGQDPADTQRRMLRRLVERAAATRFGRDHDFSSIRDVADFQRRVPLRRYEEFWSEYWSSAFPHLTDCSWPGTIHDFALTSGTTTGANKYIPLSREMIRANSRAALDVLTHHLTRRPESRVFGGYNFALGGSTTLTELAPGIRGGDLSGIMASRVPWWLSPLFFPPPQFATIGDWEEKIARIAPLSLNADVRTIGGTTSWLAMFFEELARLRPGNSGRLVDFYPNLELVVHGGVTFAPYRAAFRVWMEGSRAETREVYPASEGFIAAADRGDGDGLRLMLDNGLFFEFVPVEELEQPTPTRHWLGNLETGVNYAVVLSTCAGLWGYIIGDTVRFVDRSPPRLLITGRTSYSLSAFGEHLIGEELEAAVAAAAAAIGRNAADFAVGALFADAPGGTGRHLFVVELDGAPVDAGALDRFSRTVDQTLSAGNDDYRCHRSGDFGIAPPLVVPVPAGTFAAWMKSRGKLGGQNKVPRVINDADLLANLRAFIAARP